MPFPVWKFLMRNKNCTWCTSFGNVPVLESRLCHFLVIWAWTSHKASQYWPLERVGGHLERIPPWDAERVSVALNRTSPSKEQSSLPERSPVIPCGPQKKASDNFDTWGYNNSSTQQEEEKLLSFSGKDSANEKKWTLFPPNFPSPLQKYSPFLALSGLARD